MNDNVAVNEEDDKQRDLKDTITRKKGNESDITETEVDKTCSDSTVETNKRTKDRKQEDDETEEFLIDQTVDHKINKSRRHRYVKNDEKLYWIRCY